MNLARIAVAVLSLSVVYAAGDAKEGKTAYVQHCQNCHGANGVANPKIAKMVKVEIYTESMKFEYNAIPD